MKGNVTLPIRPSADLNKRHSLFPCFDHNLTLGLSLCLFPCEQGLRRKFQP